MERRVESKEVKRKNTKEQRRGASCERESKKEEGARKMGKEQKGGWSQVGNER